MVIIRELFEANNETEQNPVYCKASGIAWDGGSRRGKEETAGNKDGYLFKDLLNLLSV